MISYEQQDPVAIRQEIADCIITIKLLWLKRQVTTLRFLPRRRSQSVSFSPSLTALPICPNSRCFKLHARATALASGWGSHYIQDPAPRPSIDDRGLDPGTSEGALCSCIEPPRSSNTALFSVRSGPTLMSCPRSCAIWICNYAYKYLTRTTSPWLTLPYLSSNAKMLLRQKSVRIIRIHLWP